MRLMKSYVNGELGTSMSVPGSGSWEVEIVLYDEDGARIDTTTGSPTASADFYDEAGRENTLEFSKSITLSGQDGQGKLTADEDTDFAAGSTHYMYIKLEEADDFSVSPNYSIINVF